MLSLRGLALCHHRRLTSFRQMHPFTPLLLSMCSTFLGGHPAHNNTEETSIQELSFILLDIASVNNLAGICLDQVGDSSEVMAS